MKEFTVFKPGDFTVMPNQHLQDKELSLKAIGLLSKMLSLPPNWDYSLRGLTSICKESYDTVRGILNELKDHDYIAIIKSRAQNGTFRYNYLIFANPSEKAKIMQNYPDGKNPYLDKPHMEKPTLENYDQYNIKESNINKFIDKKDKDDKTGEPEIKHNNLTLELINMNYISNEDNSSFYFDDLFKEYLDNGYSYRELLGAIHYIAPRVVSRNFIDEEGNEISNKYGYFKNAMESNFRKLDNLSKELYPDDSNSSFWDSYEL